MKMFFAVFFGAFCAIMAAAATLYFIKEYQDGESGRQILRETTSAAGRLDTTYAGITAPTPPETKFNDRPTELSNEPMLAKSVTVKTADGELTIPAGKVVQTVNEKSAPGTVVINYEGYIFAVPLTAFASGSR